jgi:hypothetical protein
MGHPSTLPTLTGAQDLCMQTTRRSKILRRLWCRRWGLPLHTPVYNSCGQPKHRRCEDRYVKFELIYVGEWEATPEAPLGLFMLLHT